MIVVTDSEVSRAITAPFSPGRMCPARGPASTLGDRRPCFQEQVSDRSDALRGSAHGLTRTTPDSAGAPTVTIRDVARVAGVSYRTVSRVINGHGSASAKAPARTAAPAAERQAENRPPATRREPGAAPASPPSYGLGRYAWDSSAPEVLTPLVARLSSMLVRASDYCSIYRIPVGRTGLCRPHRPPLKAVPGDVFMRHRAAVQGHGGVAVAVPQPTQGVSSCIRTRWDAAPQVFCFSPKGCPRPCDARRPDHNEKATLHVLAP